MTAPHFPANLVQGARKGLPPDPCLASIETFATAGKTGSGETVSPQCFPPVLPSVLPESVGKTGGYPAGKTVKRSGVQYALSRARACERGMFYRFTVLKMYQDIDNIALLPKTQGKTGPENGKTGVLGSVAASLNPLKSHKKGGF